MRLIVLVCSVLLLCVSSTLTGRAEDSSLLFDNIVPITAANAENIQNIATFQTLNAYLTIPDPTGRTLLVITAASAEPIWGYVLWNVETGRQLGAIDPGFYSGGTFSPDGQIFAIDNNVDRTVELRDAKTAQVVRIIATERGADFEAFSPDSLTIATTDHDGETVRFWNTHTGVETGSLRHWQVASVAFHPDKPLVATVGFDGVVRLWNAETFVVESEIAIADNNFYMIGGLAFDQSGDHLILESNKVRVWDTETGALQYASHTLVEYAGAAYAPGSILGMRDNSSLGFVNIDSGEQISNFSANLMEQVGIPVSISPDDTLLLSFGSGAVLLWDIKTGELLATLAHIGAGSAAFSPASQYIVTTSGNERDFASNIIRPGTIRLWGIPNP